MSRIEKYKEISDEDIDIYNNQYNLILSDELPINNKRKYNKKLTYKQLLKSLDKGLSSDTFLKVKVIMEDNKVDERFHPKKNQDNENNKTYYRKAMDEIFNQLKNEKKNNLEDFHNKYGESNMISIAVNIWKTDYKENQIKIQNLMY